MVTRIEIVDVEARFSQGEKSSKLPVSLQLSFVVGDSLYDPGPHLPMSNVKLNSQSELIPCLLVVKSEPGDGVLAVPGLQGGQGEARGELACPVLPPDHLVQLGLAQHQGGLLGEVDQAGELGGEVWREEREIIL